MILRPDRTYYLYNTGNNGRSIFLNKNNYQFFSKKIMTRINPYAEILNLTLEPTSFHLLIHTRKGIEENQLNHCIGIILRSYARAINKQEGTFGSLFRQRTKAYSNVGKIPTNHRLLIERSQEMKSFAGRTDFSRVIITYLNSLGNEDKRKELTAGSQVVQ